MMEHEMLHAFKLRARGKTYAEIADVMNYSENYIRDILFAVVSGRRHTKVVVSKNHPKLAEHINNNYDGVTLRFAARCKLSQSAITRALRGQGSKATYARIREVAGDVL